MYVQYRVSVMGSLRRVRRWQSIIKLRFGRRPVLSPARQSNKCARCLPAEGVR